MSFRRTAITLTAAAALAAAATPAYALDDAKPSPCGLILTDVAEDNTANTAQQKSANTDLLGLFVKHDPSKGDNATTVNLQVRDLTKSYAPGSTGVVWTVQWKGSNDVVRFVRALYDYSNTVYFEHGELVPPIGGQVLPRYEYRGPTAGKLFEGANGVVQIVIPKSPDGAAGVKLSELNAQASHSTQVIPGSVASPTRGLSTPVDRIPDGTDFAPDYSIAACAGLGVVAPPAVVAPAPVVAKKAGPLPVKLASAKLSAKKLKKAKKVTLSVKSSEALTKLKATLRKGKKVVGSGALAKLSRSGKLTLKLKSTLKKGSYALSVAGNDAAGRTRSVTLKLTVR